MENKFIYKPSNIVEFMDKKLDAHVDVAILRNQIVSHQQEINHIIKSDPSITNVDFYFLGSYTLAQRYKIKHLMNCQKYIRPIIKNKLRLTHAYEILINLYKSKM